MSTDATWAATARLVRCAGFGASGPEVDAVVKEGAAGWVSRGLAMDADTDPGVAGLAAPTLTLPQRVGKDATTDQRQAARKAMRAQVSEVVAWWLRRMVSAQHPLPERLTFGWHDHFATSAAKVRVAGLVLGQNQTLRRLGRTDFTSLSTTMVTDPALLLWLDAQKNTKAAPNENLAREFMELFTLGHGGGYTEQDVREGARALTGWTVGADGRAALVARRHDDGPKTVLGVSGDLDAEGFVEAVLAHPTSAAYLATRWWNHLVAPTAPSAATLAALTAAYGERRDLRALFTTMLTGPEVAQQAGTLVASPVLWVVGSARALSVPTDDKTLKRLAAVLRQLGQVPLYPPNVSGWPSGQAWLSTAAATTRAAAATLLVAAGDVSPVADVVASGRLEATRHLLGLPRLSDRTVTVLRPLAADPQRLLAAALVSPENMVI